MIRSRHYMPRAVVPTAAVLCTVVLLSGLASAQSLTVRLDPQDPDVQDQFGNAVAVHGDQVLVGSILDDDFGPSSGAAYVFDRTTGQQLHKLVPADGHADQQFGSSVALEGGLAIVGARFDDERGDRAGAVYVFDAVTGAQVGKLTASDAAARAWFGSSVDVDGNNVIVGAVRDIGFAIPVGAAYVFDLATGVETAQLLGSDAVHGDRFGWDVAIEGGLALVGAFEQGGRGAAYLFDATTGQELRIFTAADSDLGDEFGLQVELDDGQVFAAAPRNDVDGSNRGAVYVFDAASGAELAKLSSPASTNSAEMGSTLAVTDDRVYCGAQREAIQGLLFMGAVEVFDRTSGAWINKLIPGDLSSTVSFGSALAASSGALVVGSMADDSNGSNAGAAFVFDASAPLPGSVFCFGTNCPCGNEDPLRGCANASGEGSLLHAVGSASVSADDLELRCYGVPAWQFGLLAMSETSGSMPFGEGRLCLGSGIVRLTAPIPAVSSNALLGPGLVADSCLLGPAACIDPGETRYFQFWFRSPGGTCASGFNVSNAVAVHFVP